MWANGTGFPYSLLPLLILVYVLPSMSFPCLNVSNSSYSPENKTATPHSILHSPHVLPSAYLTQISTTFTQWFSFWCGKEPSIFSPQSSGSYLIWGHSTTPSYAYLTVSRSINMLCHWHVGWQLEKLLHRGQLSSSKSTMSHLSNSISRTSAKDFWCELSHAPKLPMGNNYKSYC